jgi:hypothetical protein
MSIFNLKTQQNELTASNLGTNRLSYEQKPPSRDVTEGNFSNGAIHIKWECNGTKWWMPSKSFLRMRCSLSKPNGAPLYVDDNIAPNMGLCANLFQSAEFRINDKTITRISDFMPQIDALETRLNKSKSWIDSIGNSTNLWQKETQERIELVSQDGVETTSSGHPSYKVNTPLSLGILAGSLIEFNDATRTINIAAPAGVAINPDLRNILKAGDKLQFTADAVNGLLAQKELTITSVASSTSVIVNFNNVGGNVSPAVVAVYNVIQTWQSSRRVKDFELTWQPPLSVFKLGHALPTGKYELILNPQTSSVYQEAAVETSLLSASKVGGTDFKFVVKDMYMYVNTLEGERVDNLTYLLDLESTNCQSDTLTGTSGFSQKNYDVIPSTYALTVAYQDQRVNSDTRFSSSKFKSYDATNKEEELGLKRFYVNYAGQSKPSPDADPEFVVSNTGNIDNTTQRYLETQLNSGNYFSEGGAETIEDYHDRGSYYHLLFPKDATDNSTRVNINQQFASNPTNMRALLFSHYRQTARIVIAEGQVKDVLVEDE